MISAVFRRRKPCFFAESGGKTAGAAEAGQRGDGRNRQICVFHQIDASGNPVVVQVLGDGASCHLTEEAAAVFPAHGNLRGKLCERQGRTVVPVDIIQKNLQPFKISRSRSPGVQKLFLMSADDAAEGCAEKTVNLELVGEGLAQAEPVHLTEHGKQTGIAFFRVKRNSRKLWRIQIWTDDFHLQEASGSAVKERRMYDHGDKAGAAFGGSHHMGRVRIDDKTLPGAQAKGSSAYKIKNSPLGDQGDFQLTVPVAADIIILKVADIVMIDLKGKIRSAMGA